VLGRFFVQLPCNLLPGSARFWSIRSKPHRWENFTAISITNFATKRATEKITPAYKNATTILTLLVSSVNRSSSFSLGFFLSLAPITAANPTLTSIKPDSALMHINAAAPKQIAAMLRIPTRSGPSALSNIACTKKATAPVLTANCSFITPPIPSNPCCFAPDLLDSELSVFMPRLRAQGVAGELGRA